MRGAARNRVAGNRLEGSVQAPAISLSGASGNHVLDNILTGHARGIEVKDEANDNVLKGNRIGDCGLGLTVVDSTGNEVRQNMLKGCDAPVQVFPKWRELNTIEANTIEEAPGQTER
jgi:parallel beta-helix repeat protein